MKNILILLFLASCANNVKNVTNAPEEMGVNGFTHKSSLNWVKDLKESANCVINTKEFQEEISLETISSLNRQIRELSTELLAFATKYDMTEPPPIKLQILVFKKFVFFVI